MERIEKPARSQRRAELPVSTVRVEPFNVRPTVLSA